MSDTLKENRYSQVGQDTDNADDFGKLKISTYIFTCDERVVCWDWEFDIPANKQALLETGKFFRHLNSAFKI